MSVVIVLCTCCCQVELTHCDNKMVTKVVLALLALVEEMSRWAVVLVVVLVRHAKCYNHCNQQKVS